MLGAVGLATLYVAGGLLIVAAFGKLRDPTATRVALKAAHLPATPAIVIGLALAEAAVGVAALLTDSWPVVAAVSCLYGSFAGFVLLLRWRAGPRVSCGCLGQRDIEAGWLHVVLNLVVAGIVPLSLIDDRGELWTADDRVAVVGLYAFGLAVAVYLAYYALAQLPYLLSEVGRTERQ